MSHDALVDYRKAHSPFVDAFGPMSMGYLPHRIGLGPSHPRSVMATYALSDPTLELVIDGEPVPRDDFSCGPYLTEERAERDGLRVTTRAALSEDGRLRYDVRLSAEDASARRIDVAFRGRGRADHPTYMLDFFPGSRPGPRFMEIVADDETLEVSLVGDPGTCDLPDVMLRVRCVQGGLSAYREGEARYGFRGSSLTL